MRSCRRRQYVPFVLALIPVAYGQSLPPVYFNHAAMFMDKATIDDLTASPFLKEEFSGFENQTVQRDGGTWSYTGVYISGSGTYLEFIPGTTKGETPRRGLAPVGTIGFGMWIDQRERLPLIRDQLATHTPGTPKIRVQKRFVDGRDVTWFDATEADFPDDNASNAGSWVMAVYSDYLRQRYPDLTSEEDGTTREKQYKRRYVASRLLKEVTRFSMTVNNVEEDQLAKEFAAYGYTIRAERGKKIAVRQGFELVMEPAPPDSPRKLAIEMKWVWLL
jgi:Family of unknown function (DUF5829)